MKKILLSVLGAAALLSTAAVAAPINSSGIQSPAASNIDQVRLVCTGYGRCYRVRDPRYIQRSYVYDDGYYAPRSYGYYGGSPGYYDGGSYGYYGGGPTIGFSFGSRSW